MPLPQKPTMVIAPVVTNTIGTKDSGHEVLGTCFQVGPGLFMSAKHVFGIAPSAGLEISLVFDSADPISTYKAQLVYQDPKLDISIARVEGWPVDEPFKIAPTNELAMNTGVLTVEYSPTRPRGELPDGRPTMPIQANFHKGHVVREYRETFGHQYMASCIDLSYPALKGASGAPVVRESDGIVLGMIVGNVEQQLLPAQIERTESKDGIKDEIVRYFLPSGQALRAAHLREALSRVSDTPGSP